MRSDTNLSLCSLFISLMNLCAHKFKSQETVNHCNISLVHDFEALCLIYCILSLLVLTLDWNDRRQMREPLSITDRCMVDTFKGQWMLVG